MKRLVWVAPVLAVAWAMTVPATALAIPTLGDDTSRGDQGDKSGYTFIVTDEEPGSGGSVTPVSGGADRPPLFTMSYRVLDADATGAPCTRRDYVVGWDEAARGPAADAVRLAEQAFLAATGGAAPPPCGGVAVDTGAPPRRAAALVADALEPATPRVQPDNSAITGLRAFLTTGLDSERSETVTVTLFGRDWDVEVDVVGVHTIDWGDGTVDDGVTGDGGPWHDGPTQPGDITHTYVDVGTPDLVVTTDWTVTATLAGAGTSATQTRTTTSTPQPIEVDEVRAVRDR